jgi:hypothetical protein
MVACTWVLLTKVVTNAIVTPGVAHWTTAPGTKLEPFTVSVKLPLPAKTEFGLRLVITGGKTT